MTGLPLHIEEYLLEVGFSGTELLVLKRLIEGDSMTLRELASKTGKSTGVLDQATKKLLSKKILQREIINDTPKFVLGTLEAVTKWVSKDMTAKKEELQRKQKDFESFIASLELEKSRPDMEYFDGEEGMQKAYRKLLDFGNEILRSTEISYKEEEDPLREFRVQHFRERRSRKIFERVIAPNTVLGRRFQSRDIFEYRKTVLIPEDHHTFVFEKIVIGNTVAHFNHTEQKACFIHYPQMAKSERLTFERIWNTAQEKSESALQSLKKEEQLKGISLPTKTFSALREFFLSRKSIGVFLLMGMVSAALTFGLYRQHLNLNLKRIEEKVIAIATTGSVQFSLEDLNELKVPEDVFKSQYPKVIYQLNRIRRENDGVKFAYLMRPTNEEGIWEFIADADSIDPFRKIDLNGDGKIDIADHLSPPGEKYDSNSNEGKKNMEALIRPTAFGPFTNQWGEFITGWAPIKNNAGQTLAILGIDIEATALNDLTSKSFKPLIYFLSLFLIFLIIRLTAFNRSVVKEVTNLLSEEKFIQTINIATILTTLLSLFFFWHSFYLLKNTIGEKLMTTVASFAPDIEGDDLTNLRFARDMKREEYQKVFKQLGEIKDRNPELTWVYIKRPTDEKNIWEFVVDADANYFIPFDTLDYNMDGTVDQADENVFPGRRYDASERGALPIALHKPNYEKKILSDQWGKFVSAAAPVRNIKGEVVAILGADIDVSILYAELRKNYLAWVVVLLIFSLGVLGLNILKRRKS